MALSAQSLFLYAYSIDSSNQNIDFQVVSSGPVITAVIPVGFYSLTALMAAIVTALTAANSSFSYTCTADRTVSGGTENRITIGTSSTFFSVLFGSGPNMTTSPATLLGFNESDFTGSTSYTSSLTSGTSFIPYYRGKNFLPPNQSQKVLGSKNVSASGQKETIVYALQSFWKVEFMDQPYAFVQSQWVPFMQWAIQQRLFEFTPEISSPTVFYEGTLETTAKDGNGMAYEMPEQLPDKPGLYGTGMMVNRVNIT